MAAEEQTRLAAELDFYAAHKTEWLEQHSGKYVVVQDRNVLGFYPYIRGRIPRRRRRIRHNQGLSCETSAGARAGLLCVL